MNKEIFVKTNNKETIEIICHFRLASSPVIKKIVIKIYGCNFLKFKQKIKCHPAHVDYDFAKKKQLLSV